MMKIIIYHPPPPRHHLRRKIEHGEVRVRVRVTLQLTVSQSVCLGVEPRLGFMTRYLLLLDSYGLVLRGEGAPSVTRSRVCLVSGSVNSLVGSQFIQSWRSG
jgi:hypothetical protein